MLCITLSITMVVFYLGSTLARPNNEISEHNATMPVSCHGKDICFIKDDLYPQKAIENILDNVVEPIYEIIDVEDRVRYVVQSEKRFEQIVRVEQCLNRGRLLGPTIHFTENDVKKHNLLCQEIRMNYDFLVLTLDLKGVEMAKPKNGIPICCICVYHGN